MMLNGTVTQVSRLEIMSVLRGSLAKSGPVRFASEKSFPLYFVH